jgi:hypothetical protein
MIVESRRGSFRGAHHPFQGEDATSLAGNCWGAQRKKTNNINIIEK